MMQEEAQVFYKPHLLSETRKYIEKEHPLRVVGGEEPLKAGNRLEELVHRICALPGSRLHRYVLTLTETDFCLLAGYLPHDFYKTGWDKIRDIVKEHSSKEVMQALLQEWQYRYDHAACNAFLKDVAGNDKFMKAVLNKAHLAFLPQILDGDDIPTALGHAICGMKLTVLKGMQFAQKLSYFGIGDRTPLYSKCLELFYTFCTLEDYRAAGQDKLLQIIKKYDAPTGKRFMRNFILAMQSTAKRRPYGGIGFPLELDKYPNIESQLALRTGRVGTTQFEEYFRDKIFSDTNGEVRQIFINWVNRRSIDQFFGTDERSRFWRTYEMESVEKKRYSDCIVMHFGEWAGIEFLSGEDPKNKKYGAFYLMPEEIYKEHGGWAADHHDNTKLKSELNNNLAAWQIEKLAHRGYWQGPFEYAMRSKGVGKLV